LSLILTLIAFALVRRHINSHHLSPSDSFMLGALAVLAITQLFVQLTFFLHLDRESKPRWNLQVFLFMLIILLIIVVGSLWIMSNLDYRMTSSPTQVNDYIQSQDGL
jgi:cytochrome o ubiquinol oxidase operon protein cyoD